MPYVMGECLECQGYKQIKCRGLCHACYRDIGTRGKHPRQAHWSWEYEPTMEELEQCIAEQMQCLPAWWPDEPTDLSDK